MKTEIIRGEQFGDLEMIHEKITALLYAKQVSHAEVLYIYEGKGDHSCHMSPWSFPGSTQHYDLPLPEKEVALAHAAMEEIYSVLTRVGNGDIVITFPEPQVAKDGEKEMIMITVD